MSKAFCMKPILRYTNFENKMTTQNIPLVTVVIPSYNHASYVKESIQSIIDQDYSNIELIIIDDGSKDSSVQAIQEMVTLCQQRFVRFEFRHRPNKGLCATLNEALEWCEGEFFSPIASDDIALPHKISYLASKIVESEFAVVFGLAQRFGDLDKVYTHTPNISSQYIHSFKSLMLTINIPAAPAAMFRTSSVLKVGGFAEDVKLEDRYMWLALTSNNEKIITYPKVVTLYRDHSDNTTKNLESMHTSRLQVLEKFKNSEIYDEAVKKAHLVLANDLSHVSTLSPIKIVVLSKNFNARGLKTIVQALLPSHFFRLRQKLKKKIL